MSTALVLGAGGTVGMSYHAGVLRALERVGGIDPASADMIIGTSAGSIVGAYLRSGWTSEDFWNLAQGTHEVLAGLAPAEVDALRSELFTPRFHTGPELLRRMLGSGFVLARSVWRMPMPVAPRLLGRAFPGGMFDMTEGRRRFADDLPLAWPAKPLWLCTVDITSGRRIVLGRAGSPPATLHEGVTASCAIPGLYQPVRIGSLTLVDGGMHSTTNLDLATKADCDLIICVAPMAYDTSAPPNALGQLIRRFPARRLAAEVSAARSRGAEVLLLRPTRAEVRRHGANLMRTSGWGELATGAYDDAARMLDTPRFRRVLAA
ncbi:MAG: patatin-like phospholipase family protein [Acidimicrobiales bacterium]